LNKIDELLVRLARENASDLHLRVGERPIFRIHGRLVRMDYPEVTEESVREYLYPVIGENRIGKFVGNLELDVAYAVPGVARFRVNVYFQRGHVGAAIRLIKLKVPTIDEMGLPQILKPLSLRTKGLILVTGPTGSGKTTTMAAMINYINQNRSAHVLTIEDPVEFAHEDHSSLIQQREIEVDTLSFADALKHSLRQNPDVILIGEMRDLETITMAVTAAETGMLVLATLHTMDAAQSVERIVDVFPSDQQNHIRTQLSLSLEAVISQCLLPRADGSGRITAFEILLVTPAVRSMIRDKKTYQIYSVLQTHSGMGMESLDYNLLKLYKEGTITYEEAFAHCSQPKEFERLADPAGNDSA
jgi:twitching motility protein PilT